MMSKSITYRTRLVLQVLFFLSRKNKSELDLEYIEHLRVAMNIPDDKQVLNEILSNLATGNEVAELTDLKLLNESGELTPKGVVWAKFFGSSLFKSLNLDDLKNSLDEQDSDLLFQIATESIRTLAWRGSQGYSKSEALFEALNKWLESCSMDIVAKEH